MKTFPSSAIRNVALVGHGGSGKTSLAEALLYEAGAINRLGRVEDGTTVCDYDPEEHKRQISVSLSLAAVEYQGHKLNILDAPGYADFVGDAAAALAAADLALFVVSAVDGVEVQTEVLWRMAAARGLPRAIFVNKLDRERASFRKVLSQLKEKFGAGVAPRQLPIGEESALRGVVDLLADQAYFYENGASTEGEIPDELADEEHAVHDALVEGIVVADDDLMERYLGDEPISTDELTHTLANGVASAEVFPVLCGSATQLVGIDRLGRFVLDVAPPPPSHDGGPSAVVFKTLADPYVGRINYFKVLHGTVKTDAHLVNRRTGSDERFHQIFTLRGKEHDSVSEVPAGDIAAVAKLADVSTGDVLGEEADAPAIEMPEPVLPTAVAPASKADEDKLANALHRVQEEDPVLRVERNPETHQTVMWGTGETHLQIAIEKLRHLGVEVVEEPVRVPYRETIQVKAEAEGKYKKQTGGRGQFGVAFVRLEPMERGAGFEFVDAIVGGVIPRQFIPAVEKGIVETMETSGTLGFPVVDVRATVYDGKHHPVDSSEMSFKMAGSLGFKEAEAAAQPVLLEPVSELLITVPEEYQGDVIGDLNAKRGRIQGSEPVGSGEVEIKAQAPTAEILRYAIDLRSLTGGRGRFTMSHSHYDPVPSHVADRIIEDHRTHADTTSDH
ncbi:MAG TPA: elongation factor G [Acidimicrobiia bacterium]|nr:elongation factor G [Acidimicrobiia bacterium]